MPNLSNRTYAEVLGKPYSLVSLVSYPAGSRLRVYVVRFFMMLCKSCLNRIQNKEFILNSGSWLLNSVLINILINKN